MFDTHTNAQSRSKLDALHLHVAHITHTHALAFRLESSIKLAKSSHYLHDALHFLLLEITFLSTESTEMAENSTNPQLSTIHFVLLVVFFLIVIIEISFPNQSNNFGSVFISKSHCVNSFG